VHLTTNPKSLQNDLVIQELADEVLIYDLKRNKAFCLNQTAAFVWQHADGKTPVKQIAVLLGKQLKSPVTEDFVWLALDELKKENLIENETEITTPFEGLSRREALRKVGFASMIALPVISSLVAPTAAHAQSGSAPAAACASGNCIVANQNICSGCGGRQQTVAICTSSNGTCTGCAGSFVVQCGDAGATTGNDVRIL
jgi:hypothetical protein